MLWNSTVFRIVCLFICVIFQSFPAPAAARDVNRVVLAAGAISTGYYLLGGGICAQVNALYQEGGLRCAIETSKGAIHNLRELKAGRVDLALVQSDWQHHAYAGSVSQFSGDKAIKDMRALMSFGGSPLVLLARADSAIKTPEDLAGKQIDIGKTGAGRRAAMDDLLAAMGWDLGKFKLASELPEAEAIKALCGGKLDAMAMAGATPDRNVALAMRSCAMKIIPVSGEIAAKLIAAKPYYSVVSIPKGSYPGLSSDVSSIGLRVILLASGKLSDADAYALVKAVAGNLDAVKKLHSSFASINREGLAKAGISAPLHPGAAKFYSEKK